MNFKVKNQNGFTLIELIMVIVILGILSAFAIPKFANLSKEAGQSVFEGYVGAFNSALHIYQMAWRAEGEPTSSFAIYNSIPNPNGYPQGGATMTTAFNSDCQMIMGDLFDNHQTPLFVSGSNGWAASAPDVTWAMTGSQIALLGETSDVYCHYIYIEGYFKGAYSGLASDRVPLIQYNISTGEVAILDWPYNP